MDNNWKVDVVIFDVLITSPTNLKAPVLEIKTKTANEKSVIIMQQSGEHF